MQCFCNKDYLNYKSYEALENKIIMIYSQDFQWLTNIWWKVLELKECEKWILETIYKLNTFLIKNNSILNEKFRSSHRRCSVKNGVFRNFAKLTGKYLIQSLFFNKVARLGIGLQLYLKTDWHRWFPLNFAKFLGNF